MCFPLLFFPGRDELETGHAESSAGSRASCGGAAATGTVQSRTRTLLADLEGQESVCRETEWRPSSFDIQGWTGDLEASVRVCHKESPRLHWVVCSHGPPPPPAPAKPSDNQRSWWRTPDLVGAGSSGPEDRACASVWPPVTQASLPSSVSQLQLSASLLCPRSFLGSATTG